MSKLTTRISKRVANIMIALGLLLWSALVLVSLFWNTHINKESTLLRATQEARALFNKDKAFRFWAASHGGVYVPVSEETEPNPFLAHIPERDIETTSGKKLTLMNPAYMLRQMMDTYEKAYGVKGHITSLKHFREETAPDEWEKRTLKRFEQGELEISEVSKINGKSYLRLMQPLFVDSDCIKCHAFQGYKEGELKGGISLSVPLEPYLDAEKSSLTSIIISHAVLWIFGFLILLYLGIKTRNSLLDRQEMYDAIKEKEFYLRTVLDAQPNIVVINDGENLVDCNRAFFGFFDEFRDLSSFKKKHNCICELFEKSEEPDYIYPINGDYKTVLYKLIENPDETHKVLIKKDGKEYRFVLNCVHIMLFERPRNIITFTDITKIENIQRELAIYAENEVKKRMDIEEKMLEQANLAQMGEMLTMISHHWRQPLNIIGLLTQEIQDAYDNKELDEEKMNSTVEEIMGTLLKLSETLVSLSSFMVRQNSGASSFDIIEATKKITDIHHSELETKYITLKRDFSHEKFNFFGFAAYYGQILVHLLKNSEEALIGINNREKEIHLSVICDEQAREVIVKIRDNGGGIDMDTKERIFDPFYTTKGISSKTGLGLYFVKTLVERQFGGEISFENLKHKKGVEFTLRLPMRKDV